MQTEWQTMQTLIRLLLAPLGAVWTGSTLHLPRPVCPKTYNQLRYTIIFLSFQTGRSKQTVQTQIRVYTVCHSVCIFWTHYSMVKAHGLNCRIITANFWVSELLGFSSRSDCEVYTVFAHWPTSPRVSGLILHFSSLSYEAKRRFHIYDLVVTNTHSFTHF